MPLHGLHPRRPPAALLGERPPAIRRQDLAHADDPGGKLDVDEREFRAEEEGTGGVGGVDEFGDFRLQAGGVFELFGDLLGLEIGVEGWVDVAVDLRFAQVSSMMIKKNGRFMAR